GEVFEGGERKKAYPADQFHYGDDWQLVDFLGKLGLDYPVDDRGAAHGATYRFECRPGGPAGYRMHARRSLRKQVRLRMSGFLAIACWEP
ncbi:MAG: hypothetical protein KJZ78_28905, partial [Bryobacteraceae bacterium]|nr:hypothetical protein [Bryobacteraceae bacterium]